MHSTGITVYKIYSTHLARENPPVIGRRASMPLPAITTGFGHTTYPTPGMSTLALPFESPIPSLAKILNDCQNALEFQASPAQVPMTRKGLPEEYETQCYSRSSVKTSVNFSLQPTLRGTPHTKPGRPSRTHPNGSLRDIKL